jgi:hypothetical protein
VNGYYEGIELKEIFLMKPAAMEYWYRKWEAKWHADGGKDINNPKVPLTYVRQHGTLLHSAIGEPLEQSLDKESNP